MTLVLLVAITTATFAWYNATVSANLSGSSSKNDIATATTREVSLANVTLAFTLTADNDVELTDASGYVWYNIDGTAHKVVANNDANHEEGIDWGASVTLKTVGSYTIAIDQTDWAAESLDARKSAAGTYKVSVSSSTIVLLADGNDAGTDVDATESASGTQLDFYVVVDENGAVSISSTNLGNAFTLSENVLTGKFAVRGSAQSADLEAEAHNADGFTVTVGARQNGE